jgi:superfamily II DNA or RNA helicase
MSADAPLKLVLTNRLLLENVPEALSDELIRKLTLPNPKWLENERMGRWNVGTPRELTFYEKKGNRRLIIPRGCIRDLIYLCHRHGLAYHIADHRRMLAEIDVDFTGTLRPFQQQAVDSMIRREFGTLSAPTGSGKTVMALSMIAARRQPALIVVHTKDLALQWISRIGAFLSIPEAEVGLVGGGKYSIGEKVTVALVQSLYKCAQQVCPRIGHLIVDECHRAPSRTFTEAVTSFDARYMLGLSATPWRRDKLSRLIFWHLGGVYHEIQKADLIQSGDVLDAQIVLCNTEFKPYYDPVREYAKMLSELTADDKRNRQIVEDVTREASSAPGICLVLSDRKAHCETLAALLQYGKKVPTERLTGDLSTTQRKEVVQRLDAGLARVLVATGQLIGEGFDLPDLSTLFLATPIRFSGRVLQYLGRVLRPAPGKARAKVYDYVDIHVDVLAAAARARQRTYAIDERRP